MNDEWEKIFSGKTIKKSECIEFTGAKDTKGYGRIGYKNKTYLTHRLSYILTVGEIEDGLFACHKCDNPSCINPAHIFLGTTQDNTRDMMLKGRSQKKRGEENSRAKLTADIIKAIREDNRKHKDIADEYGISLGYVSTLKSKVTWRHVDSLAFISGSPKGERHGASRLTEEQVIEIKKDTRKAREIADSYGVARTTITAIRLGKNWKHLNADA